MTLWIVLGLVVVGIVYFIAIYNGLVRARNEVRNMWSQIDVQLKRRHDLIPNLVETVRGYATHESDTLEKVINARNRAVQAQGVQAVGAAEAALGTAMTGLFGLAESYPDLKANENFKSLQEELSTTENRIGFARQAYNDSAMHYNNRREVFPANLMSGGFERADMFEIEDEAERAVPQVKF